MNKDIKILPNKTKKKISEGLKKAYQTGKRTHRGGMTNKKHKKESKIKISKARLLRKKNLGYINSEITKKRISRTIKESFKKGRKVWNKDKKNPYSEKTLEKMSFSHSGKKSNFWKGGISFKPYSVDWSVSLRRSIRERDKYTCQICNEQQGDIIFDVHHIDYNKENCNPMNLITLCKSCHSKTNLNREKWSSFFNRLRTFKHK